MITDTREHTELSKLMYEVALRVFGTYDRIPLDYRLRVYNNMRNKAAK